MLQCSVNGLNKSRCPFLAVFGLDCPAGNLHQLQNNFENGREYQQNKGKKKPAKRCRDRLNSYLNREQAGRCLYNGPEKPAKRCRDRQISSEAMRVIW